MAATYEDTIQRQDAIEWLAVNWPRFPDDFEGKGGISEKVFKNWRWVRLEMGTVVFANCIQECIRQYEVYQQYPYWVRLYDEK